MLKLLSAGCVMILVVASTAFGAVPDPTKCTVGPTAAGDGAGDIPYTVTVRDAASNPIPGAIVVLDLSSAPIGGIDLSPTVTCICAGQVRTPSAVTNLAGQATFFLRIRGCCSGSFAVWVGSVQIGTVSTITSIDQDNDGAITGNDWSMYLTNYFGNLACADLDFDGLITGNDWSMFLTHYFANHACQ